MPGIIVGVSLGLRLVDWRLRSWYSTERVQALTFRLLIQLVSRPQPNEETGVAKNKARAWESSGKCSTFHESKKV
jgi:hypothetical protein